MGLHALALDHPANQGGVALEALSTPDRDLLKDTWGGQALRATAVAPLPPGGSLAMSDRTRPGPGGAQRGWMLYHLDPRFRFMWDAPPNR